MGRHPPNRNPRRKWIDELPGWRRWAWRLIAPLPHRETSLLRRGQIDRRIPASLSQEQVDLLMDDAEQLYAGRAEWNSNSEARAVSLLGAVGIAAGLTLTKTSFLLDPKNITDRPWRI